MLPWDSVEKEGKVRGVTDKRTDQTDWSIPIKNEFLKLTTLQKLIFLIPLLDLWASRSESSPSLR
jgi:hypothetical protein